MFPVILILHVLMRMTFYVLFLNNKTETKAWHAYNRTKRICRKKFDKGVTNNMINLWPGLNDHKSGESIYGAMFSLAKIWNHQNPQNCSNVKFLISKGWGAGFGSVLHVEGSVLAIAMEMGRVLLMHPDGPVRPNRTVLGASGVDNSWQVNVPYCWRQRNPSQTLECYFEPVSSCTVQDALQGKSLQSISEIAVQGYELQPMDATGNSPLPRRFVDKAHAIHRERVLLFASQENPLRFYPTQFQSLLDCGPVKTASYYYWWRAVAAAYFVRPNTHTLQTLREYSSPYLLKEGQRCIGMYVRRGDKGGEMREVALQSYFDTAELLWHQKTKFSSKSRIKTIFLGTEDPSVIEFAHDWGLRRGWRILYTTLFDRASVSARLDADSLSMNSSLVRHHDLEYLSILLNVELLLRCDAWVCTLASNFCRIIDELRATVGLKANRVFADLSAETCSKPPCVSGEHITNFGW